jgi:hypothetical protein
MAAVESPPAPSVQTEAGIIDDARGRQHRHRRIGAAVIIAAAVAAGLIVGFTGGGGSSGHGFDAGVLGPKAAATIYDSHRAPNVLLKRYSILTTHRVSAAMLPARSMLLREIPRPGLSPARRLGLDTSDIAEVEPAPGIEMWLIPGVSGLCGLERETGGGGGSCGAVLGSLGPGSMRTYPGGTEAVGFAPNAVKAVILHLSNGSTLRIPVKDNTYFKRLHGDLSITGITAASPRTNRNTRTSPPGHPKP